MLRACTRGGRGLAPLARRPGRAFVAGLLLVCALHGCGRAEPPPAARDLLALGPDEERAATLAPDSWVLAEGARVGFALELAGPSRLVLGGKADEGALRVSIEERAPETGRSLARRELEVGVSGARLDAELELAPTAEGILWLELAWSSKTGPAVLERLELLEAPRERVPIILFSVDTLAARNTSLHGYARATTPHLEALAAEAVVFEQCLANAPFTPPSYASQFSGLLPRSTWVDPAEFERREQRSAKKYETWNVPAERWTLAESLRASGYRTAAFVDNPMAGPAFGFAQGFEFYDMSAQAIPIDDPDGGIRWIVPKAIDWIRSLPAGEPYFLFVNVLDVHGPYGAPREFRGRFAVDETLGAATLPVCPDGHEVFGAIPDYNAYSLAKKPLPERLAYEPLIRMYDEEILFIDAALHQFVEALRAQGILEHCALVISSDHGEVMGAGPFKFGHGVHTQANLHVPLVVRLPGARHGGLRVEQAVQLVDLYPTLLELAGLRPRAYLHGRSLLPLCRGEARAAEGIWHEGGLLESTAVTEGKWRLVEWHPETGLMKTRFSFPRGRQLLAERAPELHEALWASGSYADFLAAIQRHRPGLKKLDPWFDELVVRELFDLSTDPDQLHDVAAEHPEVVARLTRLLEAGHERSRQARALVEAGTTELGEEFQAELRELGYVGETQE